MTKYLIDSFAYCEKCRRKYTWNTFVCPTCHRVTLHGIQNNQTGEKTVQSRFEQNTPLGLN